jgi:hypothetical protein
MRKSRSAPPWLRKTKLYIAAAALGGIASAVALVLFSVLMFTLRLPVEQIDFFSFLAFGTGCLVTGYFAGAAKRQCGLVTGIKAAVLFAVPVALLGLILSGITTPESAANPALQDTGNATWAVIVSTFNKIVIAVLCGAVGGVLGVNKNGGFK